MEDTSSDFSWVGVGMRRKRVKDKVFYRGSYHPIQERRDQNLLGFDSNQHGRIEVGDAVIVASKDPKAPCLGRNVSSLFYI
jgi:hypothetical protein